MRLAPFSGQQQQDNTHNKDVVEACGRYEGSQQLAQFHSHEPMRRLHAQWKRRVLRVLDHSPTTHVREHFAGR